MLELLTELLQQNIVVELGNSREISWELDYFLVAGLLDEAQFVSDYRLKLAKQNSYFLSFEGHRRALCQCEVSQLNPF